MAASAQIRDLLAINLALPAGLSAHGFVWIVTSGIAAVAASAAQAFLGMYVLTEFLLADPEQIRQGGVTVQAGILGLPITQTDNQHDERCQHQVTACAEWSELILPGGHRHSYLPCTREQKLQGQ